MNIGGEIIVSGSIVSGVLIYFLRDFFLSIKELKSKTDEAIIRLNLVENNQTHMDDKFEKLYEAVRDLTNEIKNLNIALQKKKDI